MTRETFVKMLAGLTPAEREAACTEMNITAADRPGLLTEAANFGQVTTQAPVITAPAAPAHYIQQPPHAAAYQPAPAASAEVAALMQQLAAEKTARIGSDCTAFLTAHATRIPPTERVHVANTYIALAGQADASLLATYKAGIEARPVSHMQQEHINSGTLIALGTGNSQNDTRTEAEKDASMVQNVLNLTAKGREAATAMLTGSVTVETQDAKYKRTPDFNAAFKQFGLIPVED